jgi:RNA polymerase sigma-70 factor (sigma-E family)
MRHCLGCILLRSDGMALFLFRRASRDFVRHRARSEIDGGPRLSGVKIGVILPAAEVDGPGETPSSPTIRSFAQTLFFWGSHRSSAARIGVSADAVVGRRYPSMVTRKRTGSDDAMGEPDAEFVGFYRAEYPGLVRSMYLIVRDKEQARDIAQEAFVQLFSRWRRISHYERPEAWVRRVAIRMAVRASRRERLRRRVEHEFEASPPSGPLDLDVLRAVAKLSGAQRAAVVLFYFEDRPVAEVAEILACSETTAKVHLHRARKRLSELLADEESSRDVRHAP